MTSIILILSYNFYFSSYDLYGKDGHCVWYDKCGRDPDYPPSGNFRRGREHSPEKCTMNEVVSFDS